MMDTPISQYLDIMPGQRAAQEAIACRLVPDQTDRQECSPWALPLEEDAVPEVYVRHLIQYLSKSEAIRFLRECWRVLKPGGCVYLVAPNLDYYLDKYRSGECELAAIGLWGHQDTPSRMYKWGYNRQSLCALLIEAGFVRAQDYTGAAMSLEKHERHLEAFARKHSPLTTEEVRGMVRKGRQAATRIEGVSNDAVERYHFATQFINPGDVVLDLGCGVGYGASLLARETACSRVIALDIDLEAIDLAKVHYSHEKITFLQGNCLDPSFPPEMGDCITSFEVLEHIPSDLEFLVRLKSLLRPGGTLVLSSPNEEVNPFNKSISRHHVRHYTSAELRDLVVRAGFRVAAEASQDSLQVMPGFGKQTNVVVCLRDDRIAREQFRWSEVESSDPDVFDPRKRIIRILKKRLLVVSSYARKLEQEKSTIQQELEEIRQPVRRQRR